MQTEARQLNSWSWMFIAAGTMRALLIPAAGAVVASGGFLLTHLHFLSLLLIVPALVYAFIRQKVYSYRFTDSELVVRDGLLTKNVRHISYERIVNEPEAVIAEHKLWDCPHVAIGGMPAE